MRIVSVVTPVTGDGVACAYLAQTWESLAAQLMPSGWAWQWVVQVDGHTPRGVPVGMPGQAAGDARVSVGAGRADRAAMARTMALARVRGQLLGMLDADDLLTPGALARDINVLAARPDIGWTGCAALASVFHRGQRHAGVILH